MNKRLRELPIQINDSMWQGLQEVHHRIKNDCNQLLTPLSDEQFKWREEIYGTILKHKQKFRAILDEESVEQTTSLGSEDAGINIPEDIPGAGSTGADNGAYKSGVGGTGVGSSEVGSAGNGSSGIGDSGGVNVGEGNAGEDNEDNNSLFV